jgi:hypothetical protein
VFDGDIDADQLSPDPLALCVNGKRNVSSGWRRVPGDQCVDDLQEKLYKMEDCQEPSPNPSPSEPKLELLNKTRAAVIGEGLQFSVSEAVSYLGWIGF